MTEPEAPILSAAEAKKRFYLYLAAKFTGLGLLVGGLYWAQSGLNISNGAMLVIGAISLFVRPKWLGLTTRPEK